MPDKIKEILGKVWTWWNKFTTKQKTIIIGITAVAVFTFAILIHVFTKPQYIQWQQCSTTAESADIIEILKSNNVAYEVSNDGLSIKVKSTQVSIANLALGAAGYVPDDYSIKDALTGGFSRTQSDADKQWQYYMERKLARDISALDSVKTAVVTLSLPKQTGTLIDSGEEPSAWIQLTLQDKFSAEQAATVARAVATGLGCSSTANITIIDSSSNLLFSGEEDYSTAGVANNMFELRAQAETKVGADVKKVLVGSQQFDMIEVACRLNIDFAEYQRTIHEYYANAGRDEGMLAHRETYEDENNSGSGGLPGTDSNDETTQMFQDGTNTNSSSSQKLEDFLPNELISVENLPPGIINYDASSLALTAITFRTLTEEDAKNRGLLDGISWEEYKATHSEDTKLEVDEDFYRIVATATGIPQESITILAYERPQFIDRVGLSVSATDILSIVLIVIILALLAFVVIRSMAGRKEAEQEEELSVENLLQSTPDQSLEDIEVESKSETRKMIEKFVDENPEAVANLLRNWLNEEWG